LPKIKEWEENEIEEISKPLKETIAIYEEEKL